MRNAMWVLDVNIDKVYECVVCDCYLSQNLLDEDSEMEDRDGGSHEKYKNKLFN